MRSIPILATVLAAILILASPTVAAGQSAPADRTHSSEKSRTDEHGLVPSEGSRKKEAETTSKTSKKSAPGEGADKTEKVATIPVQTSEDLLAIIEKQEALIKALRARIKELEQTIAASPSATPSRQ